MLERGEDACAGCLQALMAYCRMMGDRLPKTQGGQSLVEGVPRATLDSTAWHVKADTAALRLCCAVANTGEQKLRSGASVRSIAEAVGSAPLKRRMAGEVRSGGNERAGFDMKGRALRGRRS